MAWKLFDGVTREDAREPTPCRLSGEFAVGDLLCEGNHVWKCKADSTKRLHCNNTLPLESSGYIVWSLERGTPDPIQINRESEEFVEPSKIELMQLVRSKKLPPGHQNRFEPFILPISLQEYKKLFFDNDAPNFLTTFLTENGA
jgi:hypothetical protein